MNGKWTEIKAPPYIEMSRVERLHSSSIAIPHITPVVRAHEKPSVMETKIPANATPEPPKRKVRLVRRLPRDADGKLIEPKAEPKAEEKAPTVVDKPQSIKVFLKYAIDKYISDPKKYGYDGRDEPMSIFTGGIPDTAFIGIGSGNPEHNESYNTIMNSGYTPDFHYIITGDYTRIIYNIELGDDWKEQLLNSYNTWAKRIK